MKPLKNAAETLRKFAAHERDPDADWPLALLWDTRSPDHKAFVEDVVQPLWGKLADDLNNGRYEEARTVLRHVGERRASARQYIDSHRNGAAYARAIMHVLEEKAAEHGEEAEVGLFSPQDTDERGVIWGSAGPVGGSFGEGEEEDFQKDKYITSLRLTDKGRQRFGLPADDAEYPMLVMHYSFPATTTWRKAIQMAWKNGVRMTNIVQSRRGILDVLEFREHLIQTALSEYEMYGYVRDSWKREVPRPDEDVLGIIRYGLALQKEL